MGQGGLVGLELLNALIGLMGLGGLLGLKLLNVLIGLMGLRVQYVVQNLTGTKSHMF